MRCLLVSRIVIAFSMLFLGTEAALAQAPQHEIGLRITGLTHGFGAIHKRIKGPYKAIRHRLGFGNLAVSHVSDASNERTNLSFSMGFSVGRERRRLISDSFLFIHGPEVTLQLTGNTDFSRYNAGVGAGIGYVLGFQYEFNSRFFINLETIPDLFVRYSLDDRPRNIFSGHLHANLSSLALTIGHRFSPRS
ncbi:MAG: hypothetical protein AAFV07_06490 [Bacteroidota bacterium]